MLRPAYHVWIDSLCTLIRVCSCWMPDSRRQRACCIPTWSLQSLIRQVSTRRQPMKPSSPRMCPVQQSRNVQFATRMRDQDCRNPELGERGCPLQRNPHSTLSTNLLQSVISHNPQIFMCCYPKLRSLHVSPSYYTYVDLGENLEWLLFGT
jgi:hypothetical protein